MFSPHFTQTARVSLQSARQRLEKAGCASPALDARLLLAEVLGVSQETLLTNLEQSLSADACLAFENVLKRREKREPVALILGRQEFWGREFTVNGHSLIPRPDSETLIEAVLALVPDHKTPLSVLDLGTGSGCLVLTLLAEYPCAMGVGVDASEGALAVAVGNAQELGVSDRVRWVVSDWDSALPSEERFDLVISNPPYIRVGECLMPEVADFEPSSALYAGEDGLLAYQRLATRIPGRMQPGGWAVIEAGAGQAAAIQAVFEAQGLTWHKNVADLQNIHRAIVFSR